MTTHRLVAMLLLTLLGIGSAVSEDYIFTYDGKPLSEPELIPIGEGPHPGPGDVLKVSGYPFILDGPGRYAFTYKRGLQWSFNGGDEFPVAVELDADSTDKKNPDGSSVFVFKNRLRDMTPAARGQIRYLIFSSLYEAPSELGDSLTGINWERVVVKVESKWSEETGLPNIPNTIFHLELSPTGYPNDFDFGQVAKFPNLRYLVVSNLGQRAKHANLAQLSSCPDLRYLEITGQYVEQGAQLPELTKLNALKIGYCREVDKEFWPQRIEQLANATGLETLEMMQTGVTSLRGLADFKNLKSIRITESPIKELPERVSPTLKMIEAYGAPIPSEQRRAFQNEYPQLDLRVAWADAMTGLENCDNIVLRTGGTCHRNSGKEEQLWASKERKDITAFLATLEFDDQASGSHCMCCGSATVELHRAGKVVASFGMHHGLSVRWPEGPWPGDAALTRASRELVAAWLTDHGELNTPQEYSAHKTREAAQDRVAAYWTQVLGGKFIDELRASGSMEAAKQVVAKYLPTGKERALTILRLYGGAFPEWRTSSIFDQLIQDDDHNIITSQELTEVLQTLPDDVVIRDGLCRHLFGWRKLSAVEEQLRTTVGPLLAGHGLADPRLDNRMDVIHVLTEDGAPWCRAILRETVSGITPRPLPPEAIDVPGGQVVYMPRKLKIPDGCELTAAAALALVHLGDQDAIPAINKSLESMDPIGRKAVEAALAKPPEKDQ